MAPAARLVSSGRFFDARFESMSVSIRARTIREAASLDLVPFKEEVRGSNPLRATRLARLVLR